MAETSQIQNDNNNSPNKLNNKVVENVTDETPTEPTKYTWKKSLTDSFDENRSDTENINRIQSFTGYHLQFNTWKKEK